MAVPSARVLNSTSTSIRGTAVLQARRAAGVRRQGCVHVQAIVPENSRCHPLLPARSKPTNQKYLSRYEIDQRVVEQWQSTTTEDQHTVNALSKLAYIPRWIKYEVIPAPIRYVWYVFTVWARLLLYAALKQWLLAGAALDAKLSKSGTFSKKVVMERFHRKRNPVEDFQYRLALMG